MGCPGPLRFGKAVTRAVSVRVCSSRERRDFRFQKGLKVVLVLF